jgi:hypothetical protein
MGGEPSRPILVAAIAANNIDVRGLAGADGGILVGSTAGQRSRYITT